MFAVRLEAEHLQASRPMPPMTRGIRCVCLCVCLCEGECE